MLREIEKQHIPSLERWAKEPFSSESEMIEAMGDAQMRNARNPVYSLSVRAKLRLPFTDEMQRSAPQDSEALDDAALCDCGACRKANRHDAEALW